MDIPKSHLKIIRYVYKHPYITLGQLKHHFKNYIEFDTSMRFLESNNYIYYMHEALQQAQQGYTCTVLSNNSRVKISEKGASVYEADHVTNFRERVTLAIALIALLRNLIPDLYFLIKLLSSK